MLRITLREGEKAIINGAVIRAMGRTQICVENKVSILRGRDVMPPEEATSPARRLYFACMLAYIDGESRDTHQNTVLTELANVMAALPTDAAKLACVQFANDIALGDFYRALSSARELIAIESDATSDAQAA